MDLPGANDPFSGSFTWDMLNNFVAAAQAAEIETGVSVRARAKAQALRQQLVDARGGRQGKDFEAARVARDHVQRAHADGPGRAEHGHALGRTCHELSE